MYILDSGTVDVLAPAPKQSRTSAAQIASADGEIASSDGEIIVHTVGAGEFFGEIALLTRERRTASCRAGSFCELWSLSRADLHKVLEDYPELAARLQLHAQERLVRSMKVNIDPLSGA